MEIWRLQGIYLDAKRRVKAEVYAVKKQAVEQKFANILRRDDEKKKIFKVAKQMMKTNQDAIGEKCFQDDSGS